MRRLFITTVAALAVLVPAGTAAADGGSKLFIGSAVEHPDGTATFPLHRGTSHGRTVYYVLLDTSDGTCVAIGINRSQKLANARAPAPSSTSPSTTASSTSPPASTLPAPRRRGAGRLPAARFEPGAVGEPLSPLIQRPDGTVDNAPQIARDQNGDGRIELGPKPPTRSSRSTPRT